ncbi:MAG: WD40 repeat domain-containing protein [Acidobacteriota bacterium]
MCSGKCPSGLFQLAANQPDDSPPATAARLRLERGLESRPWLRRLAKPGSVSPRLLTLAGRADGIVVGHHYSSDGTRILSASKDGMLTLWNATTGAEVTTLPGGEVVASSAVVAAASSPDGQRIVSAATQQTLKVRDARTGAELLTLSGHSSPVATCAYSPDGSQIVSAAFDRSVKLWNAVTGSMVRTLQRSAEIPSDEGFPFAPVCSFFPTGRRVFADAGVRIANATPRSSGGAFRHFEYLLKVWDARTDDPLAILSGHRGRVTALAVSMDDGRALSASTDGRRALWQLPSAVDWRRRFFNLPTTLTGGIRRIRGDITSHS